MADPLLDELLSDSRSVVEDLLAETPWSVPTLRRTLTDYEASLDAPPPDDLTDLATARALCQGCRALLDTIGADAEGRTLRLAHVAVRYFVLEDDGDGDRDSPFGFDDDVEVFNAVVAQLGLGSLTLG